MTREEAIENITEIKKCEAGVYAEALEMAIKALEQEPCEDAISRREVLDEIRTEIESKEMIETTIEPQFYNMALNDVLQIIDKYRAESEE